MDCSKAFFLELQACSKTLHGPEASSAVLRDITFGIERGQCLGLSGATGSGKTTLLRLIAGLDRPDRGSILLDGAMVSSPTHFVPPGRRRIGFVFQTLGLWPHLTVAQHLEYVLQSAALKKNERNQRIESTLARFKLTGLKDRYPAECSGGERHLLAIARALVGEICLLMMDEPFNGLDDRLKQHVLVVLNEIRKEKILTMLLVSHDASELKALCDRIAHLNEGRLTSVDLERFDYRKGERL